jgi:hypothetical protein
MRDKSTSRGQIGSQVTAREVSLCAPGVGGADGRDLTIVTTVKVKPAREKVVVVSGADRTGGAARGVNKVGGGARLGTIESSRGKG